ncbi:patatin-like phospholipase family protein [Pseudoduganella namucuonensis]|uniref:Patatin-like phospholipase n=1 Tax=Pseudoduganella namucuonensis TaxID=1035707 RepID=A0A1I7LYB9_9BURK|nr:patatin-like phospholipase family protein [Pseudoduganella namucuonensis]SFV14692.1 Patatin-like phospholipase [Pseudoduganella namucuonensis]
MESSATVLEKCDVVMEGGVTSGVVYPAFICGLARRFRLRSIGGTSVGAVAAVAAAAAQFKRNRAREGAPSADDGFERLAGLPAWLQAPGHEGKSNLFSLFQPCAALRQHYQVLQAALNRGGAAARALAICGALLLHFPAGALVAAAVLLLARYATLTMPGAGLLLGGTIEWLRFGAGLAAGLLVAMPLGALVEFLLTAWSGLRHNRCGICPGMRQEPGDPPALTEWLHGLVQDIAGLPRDTPLTFGMLAQSQPPIELAFITTGLSESSSHRLPHAGRDLLFRASEMRALFPPAIVETLLAASLAMQPSRGATTAMLLAADPGLGSAARDLYFLPPADELPVLVAARLSLSFPVLLQAVPLYRLRHTEGDGVRGGRTGVTKIWLSDGGLTSNFPIHFFDSLLPTRPTFGITLQATLAERAPPEARVFLPASNNAGWTPAYTDVGDAQGLPSPFAFAGALLRTIRTWRHEALKRAPGFRDRIVQIRHTRQEGGLNLNMPPEAIQAMSESGAAAARAVIARFLDTPGEANGWRNHRWLRMRIAGAVLQPKLEQLSKSWHAPARQPTYAAMWAASGAGSAAGRAAPGGAGRNTAYVLTRRQRVRGQEWWDALVALPPPRKGADLFKGSPKPRPTLEISPRQT